MRNGFEKMEGHGVTHLDLAAHGTVSLARSISILVHPFSSFFIFSIFFIVPPVGGKLKAQLYRCSTFAAAYK